MEYLEPVNGDTYTKGKDLLLRIPMGHYSQPGVSASAATGQPMGIYLFIVSWNSLE